MLNRTGCALLHVLNLMWLGTDGAADNEISHQPVKPERYSRTLPGGSSIF